MHVDYGQVGPLPCGSVGSGSPVLVLSGLAPRVGVADEATVRNALGALVPLSATRRLVVVNRRPGLPVGMTMSMIAAEHADAVRERPPTSSPTPGCTSSIEVTSPCCATLTCSTGPPHSSPQPDPRRPHPRRS